MLLNGMKRRRLTKTNRPYLKELFSEVKDVGEETVISHIINTKKLRKTQTLAPVS